MVTNNRNDKYSQYGFTQYTLFILVFLMCTNTYFQIGNIPMFSVFWALVLFYILFRKKKYDSETIDRVRSSMRARIFAFLIMWLMYALIQYLLFANNWAGTRYYTLIFINITTFTFIVSIANNIKIIRVLNKGILFGLIINILIALWEISNNVHLKVLTPDYERRFYSIPLTFFSNANDFATFLFFAAVILTIEMALTNSRIYKTFLYILLGVTIFVIFETESRGGINGIILFFSFYVVLRLARKFLKEKRDILVILSLLMFILSTLLIFLLINSYISSYTYKNFLDDLGGRMDLWGQAVDLFLNSYLLGIGPGQSLIKMNGNVHFLLLEVLTEYGIFISLGTIMIFLHFLKLLYPFVNSKINSLMASFIITFVPISISSSSMTKIYAVWVILAILLAMKINGCEENTSTKQGKAFNGGI